MTTDDRSAPATTPTPTLATQDLFREDAYLRECQATVVAVQPDGGIVLDRTVFYPLGGGQAGDSGVLLRADGSTVAIADTRKGKDAEGRPTAAIVHVPAPGEPTPWTVGEAVTARIDWERRHRLMRFHTTTHLLCHLVAQPVNGCSITPDYARLDFHMDGALDKDALTAGIARLVAEGHAITLGTVTDAELDANPALVKSMSVQPPRGTGQVRTVRVGGTGEAGAPQIDLQPCGGTHVAHTGEIGAVVVTKIEKKGALSRRVVLGFAA
ncbi:alanyl-tRNA editing protein [Acidovorax sp. SUPP2825]|uniref:alanyl-tRNA editing protein n=1 Tax=Acidovorax sp. SUPP2825 TaxID=2920879 RepID=UPI0023DE686C|nr:alanyl-tRNA editing protein [Acidovorax sp. SUPP2825]GKS97048.1 alanyl-tRNA editing protein [Acidovorax sp. SUPP2825]